MSAPLTWDRRSLDVQTSTCGRFTIVRSDYPVRRYLAWRRPTEPRQMATLLGGYDIPDDAVAACTVARAAP